MTITKGDNSIPSDGVYYDTDLRLWHNLPEYARQHLIGGTIVGGMPGTTAEPWRPTEGQTNGGLTNGGQTNGGMPDDVVQDAVLQGSMTYNGTQPVGPQVQQTEYGQPTQRPTLQMGGRQTQPMSIQPAARQNMTNLNNMARRRGLLDDDFEGIQGLL